MMSDQTNVSSEDESEERPLPREVLDSPEMKAKIEKAKDRAKERGVAPGSTADELLNMARGVESRTER